VLKVAASHQQRRVGEKALAVLAHKPARWSVLVPDDSSMCSSRRRRPEVYLTVLP